MQCHVHDIALSNLRDLVFLKTLTISQPITKCSRPSDTMICATSWQNQQNDCAIRPVWSESLLCTQWVAKDTSFFMQTAKTQISLGISEDSDQPGHPISEDSDQTGRMPRPIWIFAGRTCYFVSFAMKRLIFVITPSGKDQEQSIFLA